MKIDLFYLSEIIIRTSDKRRYLSPLNYLLIIKKLSCADRPLFLRSAYPILFLRLGRRYLSVMVLKERGSAPLWKSEAAI